MQSNKTRAEELIEELMRQLDPDSPRYHVLLSARQFKSSWVDLGSKLTGVQRKQLFRDWGYHEFEEYCSKEIRIRRQTALKLTQAYHFLEHEAPEYTTSGQEGKPAPDFRSIDLLRQAREQQEFDETDYLNLRRAALEEQRSLPTLRKQFNRVIQDKASPESTMQQNLTAILHATRRLKSALLGVPEIAGGITPSLDGLETELLRRLGNDEQPVEPTFP